MGGRRTRGRSSKERGSDLKYNMEISLGEAFFGKTAQIRVPASVTCDACRGTGAESGSSPITCPTCQGFGKVRASQGFFTIERTCMSCQGRGEIIQKPCQACTGSGRVTRERTCRSTSRRQSRTSTRIRLAGEGEAGIRGGPAGDLYIFLSILPDDIFQRDGADLFCRVPITMAALRPGRTGEVPTIDGGRARSESPKAPRPESSFACAGKACRCFARSSRATSTCRSKSRRRKTCRASKKVLKEFEKASTDTDAHPRARTFLVKSSRSGTEPGRINFPGCG